jgi:uncharacterized protein
MPMNKTYSGPSDLPATIPLFPLAGAVLLPGGQLPLNIFEPRYLAMFDDAMRGERIIGMIQPTEDGEVPAGERPTLRAIGSAGRITQLSETGDGRYFTILSGISRFRILSEVDSQKPYREAWVDFSAFPEDFVAGASVPAQRRTELNNVAFDLAQALRLEIARNDVEAMPDADMISVFAMIGPFDHAEKQALLEAPGLLARADLLLALGEVALSRALKGAKPLQ